MQLVDTHCHIHFPDYELDPEEAIATAKRADVTKLLCVGCTLPDSKRAVEFAAQHGNIWASVGFHPHESSVYINDDKALGKLRDLAAKPQVVAIGETGLDYFYENSPKEEQQQLLRFQLNVAQERGLPLIFHVREARKKDKAAIGQAFTDFLGILDDFQGVRGVVHSFSTNTAVLNKIIERGLFIGLNGIMTFTKDDLQLESAKAVPLDKMLLETDAPFLTPTPYRGTICEPKHVRVTAGFLAHLRGESLEQIADATTRNAVKLFGIDSKE